VKRALLGLILLLAVGAGSVVTFRTGPAPTVQLEPGLPGIGPRTPVHVTVRVGGRGLTFVRVELVQNGRTTTLAQRRHAPRRSWAFWGPRTTEDRLDLEVGRRTVEDLRPGQATIRVVAGRAGTWLLHPAPVVGERTLPVRLVPPALSVLSTQNYAAQGGAGVVVYRPGDHAVRHGVTVGNQFFPGAPLPESGPGDAFCLYAVPYDVADGRSIRLVAEDELGNRAEVSFLDRFFPQPPEKDTIALSDAFMQKAVPEILSHTAALKDRASLLANYLAINGELREKDAERLRELGASSTARFLWNRAFVSLPNAKVMSHFADQRTYTYQGKVVDHQVHLGFDLASTRHAPVPAAADGVVALAEYFGIYGNTVVLDHGYGLMSLYAHLSEIAVHPGDSVARGQILGHTGDTGLAGGDHLHFTVLVRGVPVSPMEWWDAHWIRDRVASKLGGGFVFQP
jgi:murein DD-endopeptidase MepM/ murein hydrolase activator NlpD